MNPQSALAGYYDGAVVLCMIMAGVNAARYRARGSSALLLGGAFLLLGAAVFAYRHAAPNWLAILLGLGCLGCLAADVATREPKKR